MKLLATWKIEHGTAARRIELLHGDLSEIPRTHAVDVLVVSAFPNDYAPTASSVIGALWRKGISVSELAQIKEVDLREEFSCWISPPISLNGHTMRVLCLESGWRGTPPEITDDLFRALAPASVLNFPNAVVAMPLIGAGNQGWSPDRMLRAILRSAVSWFRRGLPITVLKIVVWSPAVAEDARKIFEDLRQQDEDEWGQTRKSSSGGYDVFLSYSHKDARLAKTAFDTLMIARPQLRVFYDKGSLASGDSWLMKIAESLDSARRVVALYTPDYWQSPYCKDEFMAALTRQRDTGTDVLYPIYLRTAQIPYLFRTLQHEDCREADSRKLSAACRSLCKSL